MVLGFPVVGEFEIANGQLRKRLAALIGSMKPKRDFIGGNVEGVRGGSGWLAFSRLRETTFNPKEDADQEGENAVTPHPIIYQHSRQRCKPGPFKVHIRSAPGENAME
jgi:hypothetical protein